MYKSTKNIKLLIVFFLLSIFFFSVNAETSVWTFDNSSDYNFDSEKIEFSSGAVQLKIKSDWYNRDWKYRKPIIITNSELTLTNYQIRVDLSNINFDFSKTSTTLSDIIFTDSDGTTALDYWIENLDNTGVSTSTIWVEIPNIPNPYKTIYMYYGNPSAVANSNGDDTFLFFDNDFTSRITYESQALSNAETYQTIPTYDDSGQAIHPDIVYFDTPWNGYKYWMAMNPYPNSDQTKENPSIVVSNDGASWTVPNGLTNPIDNQPSGYDSDTDMIYDGNSNELIIYYREYSGSPATDKIKRRVSSNGINWSEEENVLNGAEGGILSPAVLKIENQFFMWYVDSLGGGSSATNTLVKYIVSDNGISNWSQPISVSLSQPGYVIWHIDIKYIPEKQKYYMLYSAFPVGQSNDDGAALFFAQSDDGITWEVYNKKAINTYPTSSWDSRAIYRATFLYNDNSDMFRVWYSAKGNDNSWHTGYTERNMTAFLDSMDSDNTKKWIDYKKGSQSATIATTSDGIILSGQPNTVSSANIRTTKKFTNNIIIELRQRISNERYWDTSIGSYVASEEGFYEARKGEVVIRSREYPTLSSSSPWYHTTLGAGYMWNADDVNSVSSKARVYKMVNITANTNALASSSGTPIHPVNQWLKNRYIYSGSGNLQWYVGDNLIVSSNDTAYLDNEKYLLLSQGAYTTSNWGGNREIDYVFVRQYATTTPSISLGAEEKRFYTDNPHIELKSDNAVEFVNIFDFIEESLENGGEIKYQISKDGGLNWYWYNGDSWENYNNPDYIKTNTAGEIASNIELFSFGGGNFVFRSFFHSDGTQDVKLESLNLVYSDDLTPPVISGLSDDSTPRKIKIWNWSSDDEDATYRYHTTTSDSFVFSDEEYSSTTSTAQSSGNGMYYLYVQARDANNNESDVVVVFAVLDNTHPVITILGDNPISVEHGSSYVDAGATALDNVDGDLTDEINTINNVNTNTLGSYSVSYVVSDSSGNTSTSTR
ncbi:MAG: DUF2341 domain-containing protein, partial [Patescibacteria group bacterium]|nr:DUF2341 domain-containing protein [Patescibacteria group bacterium]